MDILTGPNGLDFKAWCLRKTAGTSDKYWRAFLADRPDSGVRVARWWGKVNQAGSTQVMDFASAADAHAWVTKLVHAKLSEGYDDEQAAYSSTVVRNKAVVTLAIAAPEKPRTANLLEVCEAEVSTAVAAIRQRGELTGATLDKVRKARAAMAELEARYRELRALTETVDELLTAKVT